MKRSNKILLGGILTLMVFITIGATTIGYLIANEKVGFSKNPPDPIIIDRQTTREELDSLKAVWNKGSKLSFREIKKRNEKRRNEIFGKGYYIQILGHHFQMTF